MHLSHSGLQQLLTCPATYYLSKKMGISAKQESRALNIGSAFHWGCEHNSEDIEEYIKTLDPYVLSHNDFKKDLTLAQGMIHAYLMLKDKLFDEILTDYDGVTKLELLEEVHELDLLCDLPSFVYKKPHEFHGILDLVLLTNKGFIIIDYKTSTQTPDWDKYLDQVLRYCWMLKQKFPDTPIYKMGIINVKKISLRKKEKENDENYLMRIKREYEINDDNLISYHQYEAKDFAEEAIEPYITNLSRTCDFAQNIDDNDFWFINFGNAVSVYGKSEFWNFFYKTPDFYLLYKIQDPMFNEDFNEVCEYRDCTEFDCTCLENRNILNHFTDFKKVAEEIDPSIFSKESVFEECRKRYTTNEELLEKYWNELLRILNIN